MKSNPLVAAFHNLALFPHRVIKHHPLRGNWLPKHLLSARRNSAFVTDIVVCVVDHFEPTRRLGDQAAEASVREWCRSYAKQVMDIHDSNGRVPQHTWFYRAEYPNLGCIKELSQYCYDGFGEIEFHLHHGHDDHSSFSRKLEDGLDFFNEFGAMLTAEDSPRRRFSYIAGNWSLDNGSGDPSKSGCDTEISALRDAGCYCDFTFPAIGSKAQPRTTNSIYYATDTPAPKSYDVGLPVKVGRPPSGDLMVFQGPCGFNLRTFWFEDAAVESYAPATRDRLRAWAAPSIEVEGRPEWMFIKLHCHGMQSKDLWCCPQIRHMFEWMTDEWGRDPYRLHFVNAREAYNIVKAAEAGRSGDASLYFDYEVAPPINRLIHCTSPWKLEAYSKTSLRITTDESVTTTVQTAGLALQAPLGGMRRIELERKGDRLIAVRVHADNSVSLSGNGHKQLVNSGEWTELDDLDIPEHAFPIAARRRED